MKQQIDWTEEIKWAERCLKVVNFNYDPSCGYADYVLPDCKNTNLDEDGYCQICEKHHWKAFFGKVYRGPYSRSDKGCMSFGDDNNSDFAGCDLMMPGTSDTAIYSSKAGGSQAKSIRRFENGKEIK